MALARLAQTLAPARQKAIALPDTAGSPLFLACRMVGDSLGIDIKPPVQSPRLASKDPLRDIAQASGVRTRRVMLRGSWWRDDHGPLLGFLTEGDTLSRFCLSTERTRCVIQWPGPSPR